MLSKSSLLRLLAGITACGAAVAATLVLLPPVAQAAPLTFRFASESASSSDAQKSVTATCPSGWQLVGAGANVNNGGRRVVIDEIHPNGSASTAPTAVTVWALEDQTGTAASWSVTAYAVCTALPIQSVVRVSSTSSVSSTPKGATASCPAGARSLLGSGFNINDGNGQVNVQDVVPDLDGDGTVVVRAHEDPTGYAGSWSVTAYAICGVVDGALEIRTDEGPFNSSEKSEDISCRDGFTLLSAGVDLSSTGLGIDPLNYHLIIDEIHIGGSAVTKPTDATIWVLEESATPEIWWMDAIAVCFDPA